jgi:hypothetical protein
MPTITNVRAVPRSDRSRKVDVTFRGTDITPGYNNFLIDTETGIAKFSYDNFVSLSDLVDTSDPANTAGAVGSAMLFTPSGNEYTLVLDLSSIVTGYFKVKLRTQNSLGTKSNDDDNAKSNEFVSTLSAAGNFIGYVEQEPYYVDMAETLPDNYEDAIQRPHSRLSAIVNAYSKTLKEMDTDTLQLRSDNYISILQEGERIIRGAGSRDQTIRKGMYEIVNAYTTQTVLAANLRAGNKVARNVFSPEGELLITKGTILANDDIDTIRSARVERVTLYNREFGPVYDEQHYTSHTGTQITVDYNISSVTGVYKVGAVKMPSNSISVNNFDGNVIFLESSIAENGAEVEVVVDYVQKSYTLASHVNVEEEEAMVLAPNVLKVGYKSVMDVQQIVNKSTNEVYQADYFIDDEIYFTSETPPTNVKVEGENYVATTSVITQVVTSFSPIQTVDRVYLSTAVDAEAAKVDTSAIAVPVTSFAGNIITLSTYISQSDSTHQYNLLDGRKIYVDYVYGDSVVVTYDWGDNQIEWSADPTLLEESQEYSIDYYYGASRRALYDNFGALVELEMGDAGKEDYRKTLKALFEVYTRGSIEDAVSDFVAVFTSIAPLIYETFKEGFRLGRDRLNSSSTADLIQNATFVTGKWSQAIYILPGSVVKYGTQNRINLSSGNIEMLVKFNWDPNEGRIFRDTSTGQLKVWDNTTESYIDYDTTSSLHGHNHAQIHYLFDTDPSANYQVLTYTSGNTPGKAYEKRGFERIELFKDDAGYLVFRITSYDGQVHQVSIDMTVAGFNWEADAWYHISCGWEAQGAGQDFMAIWVGKEDTLLEVQQSALRVGIVGTEAGQSTPVGGSGRTAGSDVYIGQQYNESVNFVFSSANNINLNLDLRSIGTSFYIGMNREYKYTWDGYIEELRILQESRTTNLSATSSLPPQTAPWNPYSTEGGRTLFLRHFDETVGALATTTSEIGYIEYDSAGLPFVTTEYDPAVVFGVFTGDDPQLQGVNFYSDGAVYRTGRRIYLDEALLASSGYGLGGKVLKWYSYASNKIYSGARKRYEWDTIIVNPFEKTFNKDLIIESLEKVKPSHTINYVQFEDER